MSGKTVIERDDLHLYQSYVPDIFWLRDATNEAEIALSAADLDAICEAWRKWKMQNIICLKCGHGTDKLENDGFCEKCQERLIS